MGQKGKFRRGQSRYAARCLQTELSIGTCCAGPQH